MPPVLQEAAAQYQHQLAEVPAQVESQSCPEPAVVRARAGPLHQVDKVPHQNSSCSDTREEPECEEPGQTGGAGREERSERTRGGGESEGEQETDQPAPPVTQTAQARSPHQHARHEGRGEDRGEPSSVLPLHLQPGQYRLVRASPGLGGEDPGESGQAGHGRGGRHHPHHPPLPSPPLAGLAQHSLKPAFSLLHVSSCRVNSTLTPQEST